MATLTMTRGDSTILDLVVADGGTPVDLTGVSMWWTAKRRHTDTDDQAVIAKTVGDGIAVTNAPGGLATVTIDPDDTAGLDNSSALWWDLQVKDGAGKVRTLAAGRLVVNADVTRATA